MVRIAPIRLEFNPRTLWFDAGDLELNVDDHVVVSTARGLEYGHVAKSVFEAGDDEIKNLKSPLKPVKRLATEEDAQRFEKLTLESSEALATFKRLAEETTPNMNPVAVEYLFEGDKAVFYFESEERVDFRELVHKLASELHVRVDMKQVGTRDSARMVGGLGHCGQELCCRRLGGEFNPVSIRMAKEQDLSLNPQKISGVCGRLMCCLRYEYDAYKDFHGRAPKKNAKIATPDGEGKVVALDVPREIVSIQVGDEKPVKVPLADMEATEGAVRPNSVGAEAWETANAPAVIAAIDMSSLFSTELSGQDKLADRTAVRAVGEKDDSQEAPKRKRRRRRRSTTVDSDAPEAADSKKKQAGKPAKDAEDGPQRKPPRNSRGAKAQAGQQKQGAGAAKKKPTQVGRNSSALRNARGDAAAATKAQTGDAQASAPRRRRRRTHKAGTSEPQE